MQLTRKRTRIGKENRGNISFSLSNDISLGRNRKKDKGQRIVEKEERCSESLVTERCKQSAARDIFFQLRAVIDASSRQSPTYEKRLSSAPSNGTLVESGRILSSRSDKLLFEHQPLPETEYRSATSATSTFDHSGIIQFTSRFFLFLRR